MDRYFFTGAQCRAARALLGWTQQKLADVTKISAPTIRNFENGKGINEGYRIKMFFILRDNGIEFVREDDKQGVNIFDNPPREIQKGAIFDYEL